MCFPHGFVVHGAPLTALIKPGGGFHSIAVKETLLHLSVSNVCCFAIPVCSTLFINYLAFFSPLVRWHGVGVPGGLEAAVHSIHTILATINWL